MEPQADEMVENRSISTSPSSISIVKLAELRGTIYRLLAALFLYPDEDRLANLETSAVSLLRDRFWDGFPFTSCLNSLLEALATLSANDAQVIVNEYNRLFLVKPKAPPHESFYMDPQGQFRGWIIAMLQGEYKTSGLILSPFLNELPDHIAVELEFMSYLCKKEMEVQEDVGEDEAVKIQELQRTFLSQHLARWLPPFKKRVDEATPKELYHLVLDVIFVFIKYELSIMNKR